MEATYLGFICFLDVALTRSHTGVISTNIYRKPTHSDRYLNFHSNHPIEHKSAVVNALAHRGNCLISNESDKKLEMKHIYKALNFYGYPARFLNQKLNKAKLEVKKVNQQQSQTEVRGLAILPHIPKLSESIKFVLKSHGIKTVFKPPQKIGNLLSSHKDMVDAEHRQGAVYKIKCADCNQCYVGETKRWFVTRKKEHMRDVRLIKRDSTALSKHAIQSEHEIDWENSETLDLENDYAKRKFIESYFINSQNNCLNDRDSVAFPHVYQNLFAPIVRSSSA